MAAALAVFLLARAAHSSSRGSLMLTDSAGRSEILAVRDASHLSAGLVPLGPALVFELFRL